MSNLSRLVRAMDQAKFEEIGKEFDEIRDLRDGFKTDPIENCRELVEVFEKEKKFLKTLSGREMFFIRFSSFKNWCTLDKLLDWGNSEEDALAFLNCVEESQRLYSEIPLDECRKEEREYDKMWQREHEEDIEDEDVLDVDEEDEEGEIVYKSKNITVRLDPETSEVGCVFFLGDADSSIYFEGDDSCNEILKVATSGGSYVYNPVTEPVSVTKSKNSVVFSQYGNSTQDEIVEFEESGDSSFTKTSKPTLVKKVPASELIKAIDTVTPEYEHVTDPYNLAQRY